MNRNEKLLKNIGFFDRNKGHVIFENPNSQTINNIVNEIPNRNNLYIFSNKNDFQILNKFIKNNAKNKDRCFIFVDSVTEKNYVGLFTGLNDNNIIVGSYLSVDKKSILNIINGEVFMNNKKEKTPAQMLRDSFGEVYTKSPLIESMIDLIPDEVMKNPNSKFLENSCGGGNFIIGLINRLMSSLSFAIKDEDERKKHIVENMIYFSDIQAKNVYFTMKRIGGDYEFNYDVGDSLKIDYDAMGLFKKAFKIVTIGNPPYNGERKGNNASETIFQHFVEKAYEISDFVIMVTPARWFTQNSNGMKEFRAKMCNWGTKKIVSVDPMEEFKLNIKGGCCYYLIDKNYTGDTVINDIIINMKEMNDKWGFVTDEDLNGIIIPQTPITSIFNSKGCFGIKTNDKRFGTGNIKCKVSKAKGVWSTIPSVPDNRKELLKKWKVVFTSVLGAGNNAYESKDILIIEPEVAVSESYIFFDVDTKEEAERLKRWFLTEENKKLFKLKKIKQDVTKETFSLISMPPESFK